MFKTESCPTCASAQIGAHRVISHGASRIAESEKANQFFCVRRISRTIASSAFGRHRQLSVSAFGQGVAFALRRRMIEGACDQVVTARSEAVRQPEQSWQSTARLLRNAREDATVDLLRVPDCHDLTE